MESINVLCIESKKDLQTRIGSMLSNNNVNVEYVSSVPRAINKLGIKKYHFIIVGNGTRLYSCKRVLDFIKKLNVPYVCYSDIHESNKKVVERLQIALKDVLPIAENVG